MNCECKIETIASDKIDLTNNFFRITKPGNKERLLKSISRCGILEPPVLLKKGSAYIIVDGFNRIEAALSLGMKSIPARIVEKIDREIFTDHAFLKIWQGSTGPVGKTNFICILRHYFKAEEAEIEKINRKGIQFPPELCSDAAVAEQIMALPSALKEYIDLKDINFRVIKDILLLPEEGHQKLSDWLGESGMKVNIFRMLIELFVDIYRRDGNLDSLNELSLPEDDATKNADLIYGFVYSIRYPQYSALRQKADNIIRNISAQKVQVDFPRFFEGNSLSVKFDFSATESVSDMEKRLKNFDATGLGDLADFLKGTGK